MLAASQAAEIVLCSLYDFINASLSFIFVKFVKFYLYNELLIKLFYYHFRYFNCPSFFIL